MILATRGSTLYDQRMNRMRPEQIVIPTRQTSQVDVTAYNQMIHKYSFVYGEYIPSKWLRSLEMIHYIFSTAQKPPVITNHDVVQEISSHLNSQATRQCAQSFFNVNHCNLVDFLKTAFELQAPNSQFDGIRERIVLEGEHENIPTFCAEFISDLSEMLIRSTTGRNNVIRDYEAIF